VPHLSPIGEFLIVFAGIWFAFACFLFFSVMWATRPASRARRRGGYIKPPASHTTNRAATLPPRVPVTMGSTSSRFSLGDQLAGSAILAARRQASKPTAHTSFGGATGDHGASGVPPTFAASVDGLPKVDDAA